MKIDITSMFFNSKIEGQTATPAWGTSIGQNKSRECRIDDFKEEVIEMVIGMTYKSITDTKNLDTSKCSSERDIITCSVFNNIFINNKKIEDTQYVLLLVREHTKSHDGRLIISYAPYIGYNGIYNKSCIEKMQDSLGCKKEGCWFVYDISIKNQSDLYFSAVVVNPDAPMIYKTTSQSRSKEWKELIPDNTESIVLNNAYDEFRRYITAIQSKPFVLLAGISGTGKSRIVRQLAYATGGESPDKVQKPYNYEIIQVRPNWHDSTELIGYETRISGEPEYRTTDFLRFLAKAWYFEEVPFFLCLDEMNLAPVEQYFAEYLSVLETRKLRNGKIVSDALLPPLNNFGKKKNNAWVGDSILNDLFGEVWKINGEIVEKDKGREAQLRETFRTDGIGLPPNLIVMGTVNMDETTFSFSRKVLDRAMTIEMNEANLESGLTQTDNQLPDISASDILPHAVEAMDVYERNRQTCDIVIKYLNQINETLKGTPFKIAYRTRNEAILYVLANMRYTENDDCYKLIQALDEVTSMKILSRIEGDKNKLMNWEKNGCILDDLFSQIKQLFIDIYKNFDLEEGEKSMYGNVEDESISLQKLKEMRRKLDNTYYCTFWS